MTHPGCLRPYGIDGIIPVVVYNAIIKKALYQFKYTPFISELKDPIAKIMHEGLIQNESFCFLLSEDVVFIPVPLSSKREKQRGYNHARLIAQELRMQFALPMEEKLLVRVKNTKPQFKLHKRDRFENIRGAFDMDRNKAQKIQGKTIFLIDDVVTTGATLQECSKILKRKGAAKVIGITFAKEQIGGDGGY